MRMEAKNKYLKMLHTEAISSVPVTKRHQKLLCSYVLSNNFEQEAVQVCLIEEVY